MNENIEKLNNWYEGISHFEKLKFDDVILLLEEYNEEINLDKRNSIREKVILGTLYVIYNFLRKSELLYIKSGLYDMDDIISSCIENWIHLLFSNRLFEIPCFSRATNNVFTNLLINNFVENRVGINSAYNMDKESFMYVIKSYSNLVDKFGDVNFNLFISEIGQHLYDSQDNDFYIKCDLLYNLLNNIYEIYGNDDRISRLSIRRLWLVIHILINNCFECIKPIIDDVITEDCINEVEHDIVSNQLYYNVIKPLFEKAKLRDVEKKILIDRFGLNGYEVKGFVEIGSECGKKGNYVRAMYSKSLNKIRLLFEKNDIDIDEIDFNTFFDSNLIKNIEVKERVRKK